MIGGQGDPYLHAGEIEASFGYRWSHSDRHFRGDHEEQNRQNEDSEVINDINLLDFSATYAITDRFSATLSLPVLLAERSQPIRAGGEVIDRNHTFSRGIGDLVLTARGWVLDPARYKKANVGIGLGAKFPTGDDNAKDNFAQADGSVEKRTVDQSIQPGDGGYGMVVDANAFGVIRDDATVYAQGSYLFNPKDTNGVPTYRRRASEAVMSVPDQFLARAGAAVPIPWDPLEGLSLTFGGRAEGVPVRDAIGGSKGFRRPGIAVSVEPGLVYSYKQLTFSFATPVAVYRNRWKSKTDKEDGVHGDAAFADFLVLFSVNYRFGGKSPAHMASSSRRSARLSAAGPSTRSERPPPKPASCQEPDPAWWESQR